ncbi:hypothetical protein Q8W15_02635 [Photobacterium damselae subsp. piscicida]|nr:hypothetical protein [Photobacterium damselae subsp. piscicida]
MAHQQQLHLNTSSEQDLAVYVDPQKMDCQLFQGNDEKHSRLSLRLSL